MCDGCITINDNKRIRYKCMYEGDMVERWIDVYERICPI